MKIIAVGSEVLATDDLMVTTGHVEAIVIDAGGVNYRVSIPGVREMCLFSFDQVSVTFEDAKFGEWIAPQ